MYVYNYKRFIGHTAHLSMQLIHKSNQNSFMKSNTNRLSKTYLVEFILLNKIFLIFTMHYIFKHWNYLSISAINIKNLFFFKLWCFTCIYLVECFRISHSRWIPFAFLEKSILEIFSLFSFTDSCISPETSTIAWDHVLDNLKP